MNWRDGRHYHGIFGDDDFHGDGVFTWPDGSKLDASFKHGRAGEGVLTEVGLACICTVSRYISTGVIMCDDTDTGRPMAADLKCDMEETDQVPLSRAQVWR